MKYCPYCGADLINSTVSFCAECGESLKEPPAPRPKKEKKSKKPKKIKKVPREEFIEEIQTESEEPLQDDYDGYYDDVRPADSSVIRQTVDKELIKKVAMLIVGVLFVIGACVALLYVL